MRAATFIGFLVAVLLIAINFLIARKIGKLFKELMHLKDERVNLTKDVINGIKQIKFLNWESIFYEKIMKIR